MQPSPEFSSNSVPSSTGSFERPVQAANLVYQCVTVAAMLLLLGSLWVF
jgi:hypothetical protein